MEVSIDDEIYTLASDAAGTPLLMDSGDLIFARNRGMYSLNVVFVWNIGIAQHNMTSCKL